MNKHKEQVQLINQIKSFTQTFFDEADLLKKLTVPEEVRYVLLGEASHGTHEYYTYRAEISKKLIKEHGFRFIAVEGDWPDCYRVNRYIKGYPDSGNSAYEVLHSFSRWPTWMWANREIADLAEWLKKYNTNLSDDQKVGFFGLDVYSLFESLDEILKYIKERDPKSLSDVRKAFLCFEPYRHDLHEYSKATMLPESCEEEVILLLTKLRRLMPRYDHEGRESEFNVEQNALVAKHAEEYYRTMFYGGISSWNLRDRHMYETLERLIEFHPNPAKGIVWAHNTHVGDARYTDMIDSGEYNLGQLVRESHTKTEVLITGFGSYRGSVIAGRHWDAPMQKMTMPPAQENSWEQILYSLEKGQLFLNFLKNQNVSDELLEPRGQRAIGVVYNPAMEYGNYAPTVLPKRYDYFIFIEQTNALGPLHLHPKTEEVPETYPYGL